MSALQAAQWRFDNRLPSDDEWECPFCERCFGSREKLLDHGMLCAEEETEQPEEAA
ncbi:hypothetical protein SJI00_07245 [Pseudomonas sp. RP23018S]|uniref:hypothetical protein n=1 Tax=Pseudomonas sp. RP23018S TaxID=3096037 RepID=UPI002ACAF702|nr:hypothetical protein [Pseudomonas sp. RP23018S]MDZ5602565.1 hypothetical protein [Pseudomonas sp. RP23018S]